MKIQIRQSVFETNSSSTHSLTICTKEQYQGWQDGKYVLDQSSWESVIRPLAEGEVAEGYNNEIYTVPQFSEVVNNNEEFNQGFVTPSGDEMVAFGYYGYEG